MFGNEQGRSAPARWRPFSPSRGSGTGSTTSGSAICRLRGSLVELAKDIGAMMITGGYIVIGAGAQGPRHLGGHSLLDGDRVGGPPGLILSSPVAFGWNRRPAAVCGEYAKKFTAGRPTRPAQVATSGW